MGVKPVTTFSRHEYGIAIWVSGKLVAVIDRDKLPALILEAAGVLRYPG
jgi:hypothetical protein